MLLDHTIPKPESLTGYRLHQLVEGLTSGEKPLFLDRGYSLLVRSEKEISQSGVVLRSVCANDIIGFELRACVSKKIKGKHRYFPTSNYRQRHDWLRKKGAQLGFETLTVTCSCIMQEIKDGKDRKFHVDQTDFAGILKVTDQNKFKSALEIGVGSTAKAFGFGLLVI